MARINSEADLSVLQRRLAGGNRQQQIENRGPIFAARILLGTDDQVLLDHTNFLLGAAGAYLLNGAKIGGVITAQITLADASAVTLLSNEIGGTANYGLQIGTASGNRMLTGAESLSITCTGTTGNNTLGAFMTEPPRNVVYVDEDGVSTLSPIDLGIWVNNLPLSANNTITNIVFSNLTGVIRDITPTSMSSLAVLSFPELRYVGGSITTTTTAALTSFLAPKLVFIGGSFTPTTPSALTSISFPELKYVGGAFSPTTAALLTSISCPKLKFIGGAFSPTTMAALTTFSFPELKTVLGAMAPSTMGALTSLSFPLLEYVGVTFNPQSMGLVTSVSLPALKYVGSSFIISTMASLTTVSAPAMVRYGASITMQTSLGNLTTVTLGTVGILKEIVGANVTIPTQKLDVATVNGILALLVSLDGTNGTTLFGSGKTVSINAGTSAAPTGQGATDKATLQSRGATVNTN
jgi:hypothetical protein